MELFWRDDRKTRRKACISIAFIFVSFLGCSEVICSNDVFLEVELRWHEKIFGGQSTQQHTNIGQAQGRLPGYILKDRHGSPICETVSLTGWHSLNAALEYQPGIL